MVFWIWLVDFIENSISLGLLLLIVFLYLLIRFWFDIWWGGGYIFFCGGVWGRVGWGRRGKWGGDWGGSWGGWGVGWGRCRLGG